MTINKVHCLFEQSGTFKNEFIKLGIPAEDYDIQNDFGQTDHIVDLFEEIRGGYEGKPSIFDNMGEDDLVFAFFPCIRFENQIMIWFRGQSHSQRDWNMEQKILYDMDLMKEVERNYELVNQLFLICMRRKIKLILENPYSEEHLLRRYWCYPATIIDKDRRDRGDYYCKPTQFWFVNLEPSYNMIFEIVEQHTLDIVKKGKDTWASTKDWKATGANSVEDARSMIHPDYANRFIREFIL